MNQGTIDSYRLTQTGEPYKSYIKTILGKLYLNVWNPITKSAEGLIIQGNPKTQKENCIVDVYSEVEDLYLHRANPKHFQTGELISYVRKEGDKKPEVSPNEFTDEELETLLGERFFTLQAKVNKMTSVAPVFRLLTRAKELDKGENLIKFLEGKLSEIQMKEYERYENKEEE